MTPLLTICIPTVKSRKTSLNNLLFSLQEQILENNLQEKIEIIVHVGEQEISLGGKINNMVARAKGLYITGIADDDFVSENYCKLICDTIEQNIGVDQITFKVKQINKFLKPIIGEFSYKNKNIKVDFGFFHLLFRNFGDLKNNRHEEYDFYLFNKNIGYSGKNLFNKLFFGFMTLLFIWNCRKFFGYTWGIMVMRKEIFQQVSFSDAPRCQDKEFVMKLRDLDLIKTEINLNQILYFYYFDPENSINKEFKKNKLFKKKRKNQSKLKKITLNNIIWI